LTRTAEAPLKPYPSTSPTPTPTPPSNPTPDYDEGEEGMLAGEDGGFDDGVYEDEGEEGDDQGS